MQEIAPILEKSNSISHCVEIVRRQDILATAECNQPRKEGQPSERDWKKGKHVTIQEEERQDRNVHRVQHSRRLDEEVSIVTTRSQKQPLQQQNGSSTERFNEQHNDVETSLSEYSQAPLIRAPKDNKTMEANVVPTTILEQAQIP
jgi:hypothetical protein